MEFEDYQGSFDRRALNSLDTPYTLEEEQDDSFTLSRLKTKTWNQLNLEPFGHYKPH